MMPRLTEVAQIVNAFNPSDLSSSVSSIATNADWIDLALYPHVAVVFTHGPGSSAEPPTLVLSQATDDTGAAAKGLQFTRVDVKSAVTNLTTTGQFTKTTQAASSTYAGLGLNAEIIVVEFNTEDLDADGGFHCLQASVADVGSTAQNGLIQYIALPGRIQKQFPPSAL